LSHYEKNKRHGDPNWTRPTPVGYIGKDGYRMISVRGKERGEHILIAEKALGRSMPTGAIVHHWDEDRSNNSPSNLLICPDIAYHKIIHLRMAALAACSNAGYRRCFYCGEYSDPIVMKKRGRNFVHAKCRADYMREWNAKKKTKKGNQI
jgi:hypothetical protein